MRFGWLILCVATPALAAPVDETPLLAPVRTFFDAFNAGTATAAVDVFADDVVIIDEFTPYRWQGKTALQRWATGAASSAAAYGATGLRATLGQPSWAEVNGNDGVLMLPENVVYAIAGKPNCERGSHTFTLRRIDGAWKITASVWTLGALVPGPCPAP